MTTKDLTKIERRFAKNYYEKVDMKYDPQNIDIKFIREEMRRTAYHEAGHFVAKLFTNVNQYNVGYITIIPTKINMGQITYHNGIYLDRIDPLYRRHDGYKLLLDMFAGDWTTMIIEKSECDDYYDYIEDNGYDIFPEEEWDISKAQKIANIISGPHMPAYRILSKAYKWTGEMLKIPSVWNAVETVAKILLSKGKITDKNEEITDFCMSLDVPRYSEIPKWERRLLPPLLRISTR